MNLVSPIVQRWIEDAREDPEAFWGKAAEQLPWLRKWDQVFEWTPPTFRWFVGGQTNRFSCKKCCVIQFHCAHFLQLNRISEEEKS